MRLNLSNIIKLLFSIIFLMSNILNAQHLKFEHYNDKDGLSHNSVRQIVQDKQGFLWLGTFSGLNRFDGFQFRSYLSNTGTKNTLFNDDITVLKLDEAKNSLWIGTRKGLTRLNLETHVFTTFLPDDNNPSSIPDEEIRSIHIDKFDRIWVGTKNAGVGFFEPGINKFTKVPLENFKYIKEIVEDINGNIWIGSYEMVSIAKIKLGNTGVISEIEYYTLDIPNSIEKNPYINFIYEDGNRDIFIGTREGLFKLDLVKNVFVNLSLKDEDVNDKLGPYFLSVARAPDGKYWVGTLGGLLVCNELEDISKGDFRWYFSDLSDNTSLVDNLISSLYFDASGTLWIGTEDGLDKYDPYENQFKISKDISQYINNQLPRIRGFTKTYKDEVVVATRHNGLFISKGGDFVPLFNNNSDIASIYSKNGNILYCGLWDGRILRYNYDEHSSETIDVGFENTPVLNFIEYDDNLVVCSFGEGAKIFDKTTLNSAVHILPNYNINKVTIDFDRILWFATEVGVVKYDLVNRKSSIYERGLNANEGLPHDNVSDILVNSRGQIWAATRKGISVYNPDIDSFERTDEIKELDGKWVTNLVDDANGYLWLNMNNSIAKYNIESNLVNIYNIDSGNRLDVFSSSGFYNFENSKIYLGGKNGILYFSPFDLKENKWSPRPVITEFKVNNIPVLPGLKLNGQIPLTRDINYSKEEVLSFNNRNFSLQFSNPSFTNEGLNKYQYILDGFDKTWIETGSNSRTVQYTNLSSGTYYFKIRSSNSDGIWSDEVSYKIKINLPFWFSWQAIALGLIIIFIITYFVRREIKDRIRLKQELITEKVNRERDIKLNNEKLRFFTNISHELRTPLTLILGPAKQLLEERKESVTDYQRSKYNLIYQNASRLFELVNQVLDFRKAQTGELKLKVSETDVLQYSKNIFESFKELAFNKKINLSFDHEDVSINGWIDRDKYDKVLYNLLSNAIKFTNEYGEVGLFIHLKDSLEDYLVIEVSDNGIGIPLKSQDKIFKRFYQVSNSKDYNTGSGIGLSLVKSLVKLHKGSIKVQSVPNKGSVFTVELPINKEYFDKKEVFDIETKQTENESLKIVNAKKIIQNTELKEKIVVIEDNVELRKYLADYLSDYYKVYEAENGQEGLKLCRQIKPVLCVSDVMMPVMDGLEFCKELKNDEFISHTPVILLTALSDNEDKLKGYDLGADGYLVKPFEPSLLRTMISNVIKTRLKLKTKFSGEVESDLSLLTHSPIDKEFLKNVTDLIEFNLSEEYLTTAFLCQELGMSSSKLYRKIKELTDLAPNEFIRTIRLKKSAVLLKSKKYNVSEVTTLIGFKDPYYFSRRFKTQFGFPPSKLLK